MLRQKILVIVGPTASGKSALAVELARTFQGEIISADSRQVYRGLDIGTGKITKREMRGVPHYLLDVASARKSFSANDFVVQATAAIEKITAKEKLPIVAGGTGFYIDALAGRITLGSAQPDEALRARLEKKNAAELFKLLSKRDPRRAESIDRSNKRRLVRAIEIAQQKISAAKPRCAEYDMLWIGIAPKPEELRKRIKLRILQWMRRGMIEEVRRLRTSRVTWKRIQEFGFEYSLVADYLRGNLAKEDLASRMESATWRYSRKQMGYWKRNEHIKWFVPSQRSAIERNVRAWLKQ